MTSSISKIFGPQLEHACCVGPTGRRTALSARRLIAKRAGQAMLFALVAAIPVAFPTQMRSQLISSVDNTSVDLGTSNSGTLDLKYVRPTRKIKARNYLFDAYGPYPVSGALFAAGIGQFSNAPPEWRQGVEGYSKRFGSDFGIAAVGTTVRYGLAEALKEDTLYYRCECRGPLPRMGHAILSTLTARRGEDGHNVFSIPALVGPYAGSMTATYGWYPNRYGAKDAFRTGNYTLLTQVGGNIALEFLYSGPHSLLSRMHLNNGHGAPGPGPNH